MKRQRVSIIVGLLLVLIFAMWLFVFQVSQSETALVTTFGKPTRVITNAGPYLKWPWPVQRVHKFDRRIQNFEDKLDQSQTRDGLSLLAMVYVGWQITNAEAFFPKFSSASITEPERGSLAAAQSKLEDVMRSAKTAVIGKHDFADFISTDPGQFKLEAIEAEMLAYAQGQVKTNDYGIELKYLGLKKLDIPESTTAAVFDNMTSERKLKATRIQTTGDQQAAAIMANASKDSATILAEADAKAKGIRGAGIATAAGYYSVFEKNPELAIFLFRLDALKASLENRTTLLLGTDDEPFTLLKQHGTNAPAKK